MNILTPHIAIHRHSKINFPPLYNIPVDSLSTIIWNIRSIINLMNDAILVETFEIVHETSNN
jgi:hypothetical protein